MYNLANLVRFMYSFVLLLSEKTFFLSIKWRIMLPHFRKQSIASKHQWVKIRKTGINTDRENLWNKP